MKIVQPITVTDSILVSSNVPENEYPAYSGTKVYKLNDTVQVVSTNVHKVYKSLSGTSGTVTFTIASPGVVNWTGHGRAENDPISFTTTGTFPTGVNASSVFYVKSVQPNSFNISATPGGTAINFSGSQSGVHTATSSLNYNKPPETNPTLWLDLGNTNRWKMFDTSVQSQTVNPSEVKIQIKPATYADTFALLNVKAMTVRLVATSATDGVLYDNTKVMSGTLGITDLYMYFFGAIRKATDVLFEGLPLYGDITYTLTVNNGGSDAAVGACLFGQATDISSTKLGVEQGAKLGITDYSIKSTDAFGNYTITQRAFSRKNDYQVYVNNTDIDFVYNLLSDRRAIPTLYIGSPRFGSSMVYGFYKDFSIDISYYDCSVCSITLEGLT